MRWVLAAFLGALVLAAAPAPAATATVVAAAGGGGEYLQELTRRARAQALGWERPWLVLLHYRRHALWGWASEADAQTFFFSANGKKDPQAELEATLAAFFGPLPAEGSDAHPQCRFPARYRWLARRLEFDGARLRTYPCPAFDHWRKTLDVGALTLIFASSYLNNPASMYGHTFLRLDRRGTLPGGDLLSYVVSFSAKVDTSFGLAYAAKGLFGGFEGRFSTEPYYLRVQKYSNIESRDLWEYHLKLTPEQIGRLVDHLWEMRQSYFDYWFFDENCSYHLLSLIEAARPELHLREQYHIWTVPTDTVRSLLDVPDLVGAVEFRPSLYRRLRAQRAGLSAPERALARKIAEEEGEGRFDDLRAHAPGRQAAVLDVADLYLRYRVQAGDAPPEVGQHSDRQILLRRGRLRRASEPAAPAPPERPDTGHHTSRLGVGFGVSRRSSFEEISLRPTLHDFLSPGRGFAPGTRLEMGSTRLRLNNDDQELTIERLELVRIVSLWPVDPWSFRLSWKASTGLNLPREKRCFELRCVAYDGRVGGGVAFRTRLWRGETSFFFADAEAAGGAPFRDNYRLGAGGSGGIIAELAPWWRALGQGRYLYPLAGDGTGFWEARAGTSFTLGRDLELRLSGVSRPGPDELTSTLYWYF